MRTVVIRIVAAMLSLLFFAMLPVILLCATGWQKLGVVPIAYFCWVFARHAARGDRLTQQVRQIGAEEQKGSNHGTLPPAA
jgi:hypothetical protein